METIVVIGVLALVAIGLALWPFRGRRSTRAPAPVPQEPAVAVREELEARYAALAELDEDFAAGKFSPQDYSQLRAEMESAAAALLVRVEGPKRGGRSTPRRGEERRPAMGPGARAPRFRRLLLVAGAATIVLLAGVSAGLLLSRELTEAPPPSKAPLGQRPVEVRRGVRPGPTDVKGLLAFGHQVLDQGQTAEAISAYSRVLALEPNNLEALTHTGIALFQAGHVDQALAHLDRALALEPTSAHALWDKAQILYHAKQDYAGAIKTLEAFLAVLPQGEDAGRARAIIAEARIRMRAGKVGSSAPSASERIKAQIDAKYRRSS